MSKLLIIDGNNILLRALFAPSDTVMTTSDGVTSGVLYRCMNSIFRHIKAFQPTHFVCVFDHGRSEYRVNLRPEYKANRDSKDDDPEREARKEEFLVELGKWQDSMDAMFLGWISQPKVEADDIIASLVEHYPGQKLIISPDHDLLQLVSESCRVHSPAQNRKMESVTYTIGKVREKYGCAPDDLPKLWGLSGDKGDNIIGLYGVGEKKALKSLNQHNFDYQETVEFLTKPKDDQDTQKSEEDKERLLGNLDLIQLHPELFSDFPEFDGLEVDNDLLRNDIERWAKEWEFSSFLKRLHAII